MNTILNGDYKSKYEKVKKFGPVTLQKYGKLNSKIEMNIEQ